MFEVVILKIKPELLQAEFNALLPIVSLEKQERIRKFRFFQDARNCLLGDVLSRIEICRITGLRNKELIFSVNDYGKPILTISPNVHFNISHTGNYIACAISNEPVGIDIEIIKTVDLKIAERFFTLDEATYIMDDESIFRFYEIWTKKESRIKLEGKGLHKPLSSFSVFDSNVFNEPIYHNVFQNDEAICYVCSMKDIMPYVRLLDTFTFMQNITL